MDEAIGRIKRGGCYAHQPPPVCGTYGCAFLAGDAANEESSVFWRAKFPSQPVVLFGYVRLRADFFPEIMAEAKRLIEQSKLVLIDMSPSLTPSTTKNSDLKLVCPGLARPNQDELKTILATSPAKNAIESEASPIGPNRASGDRTPRYDFSIPVLRRGVLARPISLRARENRRGPCPPMAIRVPDGGELR